VEKNTDLSSPAAHGLFGAAEILQRFGNASFLCDANVRGQSATWPPARRPHFGFSSVADTSKSPSSDGNISHKHVVQERRITSQAQDGVITSPNDCLMHCGH
jgi:hypothetical protein